MDSEESTKELIEEISSYLRRNRSSLPDESVRLLVEARAELQQIRSKLDSKEDLRERFTDVCLRLLRFFSKPEVMEYTNRVVDDLDALV